MTLKTFFNYASFSYVLLWCKEHGNALLHTSTGLGQMEARKHFKKLQRNEIDQVLSLVKSQPEAAA